MEVIPEGMTSIIQVCTLKSICSDLTVGLFIKVGDIAINRTLKARIRDEYERHHVRTTLEHPLQAGERYIMKRESLIRIIEEVFDDMNRENSRRRWISAGFKKCGQDPFEFESESKASLEAHLQELYKLSVYKNMQTCKSVLSLE